MLNLTHLEILMHLHLLPSSQSHTDVQRTKGPARQQRTRRVPATLTLSPTAQCGSPDLDSRAGHYTGVLQVGTFTASSDDGHRLGMIAYVLNVGNVEVRLPSLPGELPIIPAHRHHTPPIVWSVERRKSPSQRERDAGIAQALFVKRFASGLQTSTLSAKASRSFLDWWEVDCLAPALAAVPVELQVNRQFERGDYDEHGEVRPRKRPAPDQVACWSRYLKELGAAGGVSV